MGGNDKGLCQMAENRISCFEDLPIILAGS
jgi:hypothetical protein